VKCISNCRACTKCLHLEVCVCVCVCIYIHLVARSNSCKNVELRGCGIFYFLATRSSQMNAKAASDIDPEYLLNPRSIVSIQVCLGDVWVGVVWACILLFVWL